MNNHARHSALVIDDDTAVLSLIDQLLTEVGFITTCMERGLPAIEILGQQHFDLLVIDLGLPDVDGMQICQTAREQYGNNAVILVISADTRIQRCMTAFQMGADDFLGKPFDIDEFTARVNIKLRQHLHSGMPIQS